MHRTARVPPPSPLLHRIHLSLTTINSLYSLNTSRGLLSSPNSGEQRRNKLQYLSAQEGVLEPISVYRMYERTNALTRLLRYKVHALTVSIRAEPSDVHTRVQFILEEPLQDHSFRAPLIERTTFDTLLPL